MGIAADMADITAEQAGDSLRYFAHVDPEDRTAEPLVVRSDLSWTEAREREVETELNELVAKESYEHTMDAENVNQIIKVADDKVLFTGFVDEEVVVAAFERGVFPKLPAVVGAFREYMVENDVEFIALDM